MAESAESHIKKAESILNSLTRAEFHKTRAAEIDEATVHAMLAQAIATNELKYVRRF